MFIEQSQSSLESIKKHWPVFLNMNQSMMGELRTAKSGTELHITQKVTKKKT